MPPRVACLSLWALLALPSLAAAEPLGARDAALADAASREGEAEPEAEPAEDAGDLEWDPSLRRLRPWEHAIGPLLVTSAFVAYLVPPEPDLDFAAGNRFDQEIQDVLSVRSNTYRKTADVVSDVGFYGSMIYRGLEDLLVVGWARDGWPVASQLVSIDMMAFGLVGTVVWGSQIWIGRQRPSSYYCETEPGYAEQFGSCGRYGATRSFLSGHFAAAVAGASLTCLYHDRFQIYRRPRAGAGACGTSIALAALTGVARITGDGHWMTDMLGGAALGFAAGWVLPRAVLFRFGDPTPHHYGPPPRVTARVQPFFDRASAGLETRGAF